MATQPRWAISIWLAVSLVCQAIVVGAGSLALPVAAQDARVESVTGEEANLTVENVTVEGNRLVPTEDILGVVKTRRGDRFSREQVLQDLKAINGLGYFDDRNLQVVPELAGGGVLLKIRVQENAPVTQFAFAGNQVMSTEEIQKIFANQLGKPQNLNELSSAIDKVEQAYHEKGYVLARIVDVTDDPDGSISVAINEGQIGDIQVVGNKKTKNFIIRNAIKIKPGSVYNERQLTADLRKLYANGYFQDIRRSLVPDPSHSDRYVLKVEVDEKRTGSIGLGGGVDTIAGPFGSFSMSDGNFRGRGQVLSFNAQVGSGLFGNISNELINGGTNFLSNRRTFNVEATWIEPNFRGTNTSLALSAFARDFNSLAVDWSQQRTVGSSMTFTRPLGHNLTGNLGLIGETTHLFDVGSFFNTEGTLQYLNRRALELGKASDSQTAGMIANEIRNKQLKGGTYLTVNPSVHYDSRDNMFDPTKGTLAKLTASPSLGLTGGGFAKLGASVSKYVPVSKDATLAFGVQGGTSLGPMPQFAQYRLGGWNGVRGYRAFSDLGSGSSMLMASAEMRFKLPIAGAGSSAIATAIQKNVKGTFFVDAGQVTGNSLVNSFFQRSTLGASVGLGLRIRVPMVGMVRLDYGLPLVSSLLGKTTPRVTVGFGEKF
ncbi:MAG: BamA/TamA family outer membrane protein [Candidatus Melainabacteria bacterium]|nr:BamA/TamA family outer membrane protein [Candidatus Melainabacteria bacterium]